MNQNQATETPDARLSRLDERTKIMNHRIVRIEAIVIFEMLILLAGIVLNFT